MQESLKQFLSADTEKKARSQWKSGLRCLVSVLFLILIYSAVDLGSLIETIKRISWSTAVLIASLYAFGQLISTIKWRIFIQGVGITRSLNQTIRAYFFGMFVNTFGLGTLGGDVARGLVLRPGPGRRAAALATVVADRLHGLGVLVTLGAVSIVIVRPPVLGSIGVYLAAALALFLACGWWIGPKLLVKIFPAEHKFGRSAILAKEAFPRGGKPFLTATTISLFFHSVHVYMHFIIAKELGAPLPLAYLFATVPLVNVASALPISINGLGVREAMYMLFFIPAGMPRETAVALGAIWILSVTIVSALGGLLLQPDLSSIEPEETTSHSQDIASEHEKRTACA